MCRKGLKSQNIVTLQSKNKNNAFKAEVKFTKLKMKVKKSTDYLSKKAILITSFTVTLQLVLSDKYTYL